MSTEKKGFGLRATGDISKYVFNINYNSRGRFVIEYCGEVIPQNVFLKRTFDYSESGVEHFYFMSLQSNEVNI